jgi:hypothetical protein
VPPAPRADPGSARVAGRYLDVVPLAAAMNWT